MCLLMFPERQNSGGISKAISVLRLAESVYLAFAKRFRLMHHTLSTLRQPLSAIRPALTANRLTNEKNTIFPDSSILHF